MFYRIYNWLIATWESIIVKKYTSIKDTAVSIHFNHWKGTSEVLKSARPFLLVKTGNKNNNQLQKSNILVIFIRVPVFHPSSFLGDFHWGKVLKASYRNNTLISDRCNCHLSYFFIVDSLSDFGNFHARNITHWFPSTFIASMHQYCIFVSPVYRFETYFDGNWILINHFQLAKFEGSEGKCSWYELPFKVNALRGSWRQIDFSHVEIPNQHHFFVIFHFIWVNLELFSHSNLDQNNARLTAYNFHNTESPNWSIHFGILTWSSTLEITSITQGETIFFTLSSTRSHSGKTTKRRSERNRGKLTCPNKHFSFRKGKLGIVSSET